MKVKPIDYLRITAAEQLKSDREYLKWRYTPEEYFKELNYELEHLCKFCKCKTSCFFIKEVKYRTPKGIGKQFKLVRCNKCNKEFRISVLYD